MNTIGKSGLLIVLVGVMAACTPSRLPTMPKEQAWEQRQVAMQKTEQWDMRGRIHQGGTFSFAASMSWLQQDDFYKINVIGPFGNPNIAIKGDQQLVKLRWSDGELVSTNPERDWQKKMGWHLPVRNLKYWIRGIPSPKNEHQLTLDEFGQAAQIKQSGWTITYEEYGDQKQGTVPYPIKLIALKDELLVDKDGKPVPLTFTVLVKRWFR